MKGGTVGRSINDDAQCAQGRIVGVGGFPKRNAVGVQHRSEKRGGVSGSHEIIGLPRCADGRPSPGIIGVSQNWRPLQIVSVRRVVGEGDGILVGAQ